MDRKLDRQTNSPKKDKQKRINKHTHQQTSKQTNTDRIWFSPQHQVKAKFKEQWEIKTKHITRKILPIIFLWLCTCYPFDLKEKIILKEKENRPFLLVGYFNFYSRNRDNYSSFCRAESGLRLFPKEICRSPMLILPVCHVRENFFHNKSTKSFRKLDIFILKLLYFRAIQGRHLNWFCLGYNKDMGSLHDKFSMISCFEFTRYLTWS